MIHNHQHVFRTLLPVQHLCDPLVHGMRDVYRFLSARRKLKLQAVEEGRAAADRKSRVCEGLGQRMHKRVRNLLELKNKVTQTRLCQARPRLEARSRARNNVDLQKVFVAREEFVLLKQPHPGSHSSGARCLRGRCLVPRSGCLLAGCVDFGSDALATADLFFDHAQSRVRHIVRRIHRRVGRRDDRHEVFAVGEVEIWVPDLETIRRDMRDGRENHRVGPLPLVVHEEKLGEQSCRRGSRVQLADARGENCPRDAAEVAHDIGVHSAALGPLLDGAERGAERVDGRHE
mmetsp:Transcript_13543/g.36386  ORF Transcript_13543/g.36386 Transcript_13543/m.36386 type:complete len:289 (-) Transcript_13543:667-1533(-)